MLPRSTGCERRTRLPGRFAGLAPASNRLRDEQPSPWDRSASPGGPSPCPGHYPRRSATRPPPPSLPHASIFASHSWVKRCGSSPVPTSETSWPVAACFTPGGLRDNGWSETEPPPQPPSRFGSGASATCTRSSSRRLRRFLFVGVGQRAGRSAACGWQPPNFCPQAPDPGRCRRPTPVA
jgi:hypothetical protein